MTATPAAPPPSVIEIAERVDRRLETLLTVERDRWAAVDDRVGWIYSTIERFVAGGKRLRPSFCYWGHVGAGGDPDDRTIIDAGAAYELLHAFALMHDDVMDDSARRRGEPTVHVDWAGRHRGESWRGEDRRFGEGMAILAGDLLAVYADQLLADATDDARRIWAELRIELNVGQYLDMVSTAQARRDLDTATRVARYKSAKYTIERPLHLGAAIAGRIDDLAGPYSDYGLPLGEAFQYRDDILGAFGDPALTGKPVGEDFREGKPTTLLALAHRNADPDQVLVLDRVGRPGLTDGDIAAIQAVLVDSGARAEVEEMITQLTERAIVAAHAASIGADSRCALIDLAHYVAARQI